MKKLLIIANLIMILSYLISLSHFPPQIPLFFSRAWGEDQLTDNWLIFLLPLLLTIFFIINSYIYNRFFVENIFVKKIIDYLNLFLVISISLIFLNIILIVR